MERFFDGDVLLGTAGTADALLVERVEQTAERPNAPLIFSETVPFEITPEDLLRYDSYDALLKRSTVADAVRRATQEVLADARASDENIVTIARLDWNHLRSVVRTHEFRGILAPVLRCRGDAVPRWLPGPHLPTRALVDGRDGYRFAFVLDPTVAYEAELLAQARGREAEVSLRVRRVRAARQRLIEVHAMEIEEFEHPLPSLSTVR
ncbi:MAG: hypothetical protein K8W52_43675 [Deltaproteobacteria bacterium]|nr:hypothetical protein [Deltaproteobacteria bacterium]